MFLHVSPLLSHINKKFYSNLISAWLLVASSSLCISLYTSADVFVSIDCGSSDPDPYKDENGISWVGDGKFVKTGESRSVKPSDSISRVADTMRVFTTGKKNCYSIDSVSKGRVLVRASFYYGNYDDKSSPPTFALLLDGNNWTQVLTSSTEYYYYEVTYVMKTGSISVCVAQTEADQFPFITALEVRSLETFMYRQVDDSTPLFIWRRVAFGTNTTIRYGDDPYDRLWAPGLLSNESIRAPSEALFSNRSLLEDRPPPAVLKHAMVGTSPNSSIELPMGFPDYEISVYINLYFSEITRLGPNQNRSFSVFKDNKSFSNPFSPPYEDCNGKYVSGITVSSNTTFSLVPTNVSTLPPLINAMEIFRIGESKLTDGTNMNDVQGLASLQESFSVLKDWSGDPCLPAPYTWDWIECNNDSSPRVTALFLSSYGLSGFLPDFSSMNALQTIDVYNNSLRGAIPDFLGSLPKLKTLNLGNNKFNGNIPASLSTKTDLNLTVGGNPDLCTSSCKIPATAPPPATANSSFKTKNFIHLLLLIPSIVILYSVG